MPRIPIYIDSPMATSVTRVYADAKDDQDDEMKISLANGESELEPTGLNYIRDREQSQALNLMHRLGSEQTMVLFAGYQAEGTLGRQLIEGHPTVKIFGQEIVVKAQVDKINALSAHPDQGEILHWLSFFKTPPKKTFIVHGEPPAQLALAEKIKEYYGWETVIPDFGDVHELRN